MVQNLLNKQVEPLIPPSYNKEAHTSQFHMETRNDKTQSSEWGITGADGNRILYVKPGE